MAHGELICGILHFINICSTCAANIPNSRRVCTALIEAGAAHRRARTRTGTHADSSLLCLAPFRQPPGSPSSRYPATALHRYELEKEETRNTESRSFAGRNFFPASRFEK